MQQGSGFRASQGLGFLRVQPLWGAQAVVRAVAAHTSLCSKRLQYVGLAGSECTAAGLAAMAFSIAAAAQVHLQAQLARHGKH